MRTPIMISKQFLVVDPEETPDLPPEVVKAMTAKIGASLDAELARLLASPPPSTLDLRPTARRCRCNVICLCRVS